MSNAFKIQPPSNAVKVAVICSSYHSIRPKQHLTMERYKNWLNSLEQERLDFIYELTRLPKQELLKKASVYCIYVENGLAGVFVAKRVLAEYLEQFDDLSCLTVVIWNINSSKVISSHSAADWLSSYMEQFPNL